MLSSEWVKRFVQISIHWCVAEEIKSRDFVGNESYYRNVNTTSRVQQEVSVEL